MKNDSTIKDEGAHVVLETPYKIEASCATGAIAQFVAQFKRDNESVGKLRVTCHDGSTAHFVFRDKVMGPKPTASGRAMLENMIAGRDPWARPRWRGKNLLIVLSTLIRNGWAERARGAEDGPAKYVATDAGRKAVKS